MSAISTISECNYDNFNALLRGPLIITKELFSSSTEFNLEKFVFDVNQYIGTNPTNKETISNILGVFSTVRPKQQEFLTKIEKAISITHSSMEKNFEKIHEIILPFILKLETTQSPLLEFIKNDDFENLQRFVSTKVDFDFKQTFEIEKEYDEPDYVNLLDICAYYGSVQCFKYLVSNKAPFSEYVCPFSICGGNYEIIHYLENNYEEQNFDSGSCLDMSIAYHRSEITDWLILNYGLEITDVETAIRSFNFSVFSLFTMNQKVYDSNKFIVAVESGNLPVVQYLCEVAKVNTETKGEWERTPLHIACSGGFLPVVQYLCEVVKVNTEEEDMNGNTPLHIACSGGSLPIVQFLCEFQKVNKEARNKDGKTPLYIACEKFHLQVIQYLYEVQKVNTELIDKHGEAALHCACYWDNLPVVQYLCEVAKVDIQVRGDEGQRALHDACSNGSLSVVKYLCEVQKINPEIIEYWGHTPLHIACKYGHLPVVQYLSEVQKVDTEAEDEFQRTPLHIACENGELPIVQYLCEVAKVNTEARDVKGRTALYTACERGILPVVKYLCEVAKVSRKMADYYAESQSEVMNYLKSIDDLAYK